MHMDRYTPGPPLHQELTGAGGPNRVGDDFQDRADPDEIADAAPGERAVWWRRRPVESAEIDRLRGHRDRRAAPEFMGWLWAQDLHHDGGHGGPRFGLRCAGLTPGGLFPMALASVLVVVDL